tara:strand:+ start:183 stop:422 length:240 start_codon:yes stop_codon:yes gene_type:complete
MTFTVYSKDNCPYCEKIQQLFNVLKLEHRVYKLGVDFTRDQFISEFGKGSTFPRILLKNGELIGGCSETIKYLKGKKML